MDVLYQIPICIMLFGWLAVAAGLSMSPAGTAAKLPGSRTLALAICASVIVPVLYEVPWAWKIEAAGIAAGVAAMLTSVLAVKVWLAVVSPDGGRDGMMAPDWEEECATLQRRFDSVQRKLKNLTRISGDWFWQTDENGIITQMSDGVRIALGRSPQYFVGKAFDEIVLEGSGGGTPAHVRIMRDRKTFRDCTVDCRTHEGQRKTFRMSGYPIKNGAGEFIGYYGLASDVTSLIELKEARAASKAQDAFFAMVSHDMRTPLNGVLGILEVLQRQLGGEGQRKLVATAEQAGETLLGLINEILDISRLRAGHLELHDAPADVVHVARETVHALQALAAKAGNTLTIKVEGPAEAWVKVDAQRYRQVLFNIIGNALKFTTKGRVNVTVSINERPDGKVALMTSIADTGPGISKNDQARIFEAFTMLERSGGQIVQGSGLGLALCQQLIEKMGGRIDVDSEPGRGSRFHFNLVLEGAEPVRRDVIEKRPVVEAEPISGGDQVGGPRRVLLAEDDAASAIVVKHHLADSGYVVTHVTDGRQVVDAFENGRFDIIIMDVSMPVMDGAQATRVIRQFEAADGKARTPIVGLTAHAAEREQRALLECGMTSCLTKPVRRRVLLDELARLAPTRIAPLDQPQAEPALRAAVDAEPAAGNGPAVAVAADDKPAGNSADARRGEACAERTVSRDVADAPVPATNAKDARREAQAERRTVAPKAGPDPVAIPVLDEAFLATVIQDVSADELKRLTRVFDAEIERRAGELIAAHTNGDLAQFKSACHALRGSSNTFGAKRLAIICERLETACLNAPSTRLLKYAGTLEKEIAAVRQALARMAPDRIH